MRRLVTLLTIVLASSLVLPHSLALAQDEDRRLVSVVASGSPYRRGAGQPIEVGVVLSQAADLRLQVTDFEGRVVRDLFDGPAGAGSISRSWHGRDADLERLPNGPYRIEATAAADGLSEDAHAWVTLADRAVYPEEPGFITIAVDPGHGGSYDGAVGGDGTREADLNLDIGLRLARMLEGAGVNVVITRTTDDHVNSPPQERTGDGVIDDTDELAARPDAANTARADLFLAIHNNIAVNESVGGPSTFYFDERPFGSRSARLAHIVQEEMVAGLAGAVNGAWQPYDHGALIYPYYVLRAYDPPRLLRPTQMPGVLSEGLFLSNERELALLRRPAIRAAMADAYYDAIAKYLARRGAHLGYELVSGPAQPAAPGETVRYEIEVRNQGTEPIRDWRLHAVSMPAPSPYVGRLRKGKAVGEARLPRLAPGQSTVVEVVVRAPAKAGEWTLLFDGRDRDGARAAELGSPMLQVRLDTADPLEPPPVEPPPSPLPEPTEPTEPTEAAA